MSSLRELHSLKNEKPTLIFARVNALASLNAALLPLLRLAPLFDSAQSRPAHLLEDDFQDFVVFRSAKLVLELAFRWSLELALVTVPVETAVRIAVS